MTTNREIQFFIGVSDDGTFAAATKVEPFFCLVKNTQDEAIKAALEAWRLYFKVKGQDSKIKVTDRKPLTINERHFKPTEVVTAQAC